MRTLNVVETTSNTIRLTWEKPVYEGGSVHFDYVVTYSKKEMESVKENTTKQLFITLDQLEPLTKYNIAVKARNPGGESAPTKTSAITESTLKTTFPRRGFAKCFS